MHSAYPAITLFQIHAYRLLKIRKTDLTVFHVHLFNGYGRGGEALFLGVLRWAGFNIPMLFLLNHFFGMFGIVSGQFCADLLTVIVSAAVHRRYANRTFRVRA